MAQLKTQRNAGVRKRRNDMKVNNPVRYESMKEKERLRGQKRRGVAKNAE